MDNPKLRLRDRYIGEKIVFNKLVPATWSDKLILIPGAVARIDKIHLIENYTVKPRTKTCMALDLTVEGGKYTIYWNTIKDKILVKDEKKK